MEDSQGKEMGYNTIETHFTGTTGLLEIGSHTADDYGYPVPGVGTITSDNEFWQAFAGSNNENGMGA